MRACVRRMALLLLAPSPTLPLQVWTRDYRDSSRSIVLADHPFPPGRHCFVSALCHVPALSAVLAACLDGTLKVRNGLPTRGGGGGAGASVGGRPRRV